MALLVTRPLSTLFRLRPPGTLRVLEQVLDLLIGAGFTPVGALHAICAYIGFLYGHVLTELQELVTRAWTSYSPGCKQTSRNLRTGEAER